MPSDPPQPTSRSRLVFPGAVIAAFAFAILVLFSLLEAPRYIVLDLSPPSPNINRSGWMNAEFSAMTWSDQYSKSFLWRVEDRVPVSQFPTWESVFQYFDTWLIARGWMQHPAADWTSCKHWLPETAFLQPGTGGYLVYYRAPEDPYGVEPLVCIAIIPYSWSTQVDGFRIILTTGNPSPLTRFLAEPFFQ